MFNATRPAGAANHLFARTVARGGDDRAVRVHVQSVRPRPSARRTRRGNLGGDRRVAVEPRELHHRLDGEAVGLRGDAVVRYRHLVRAGEGQTVSRGQSRAPQWPRLRVRRADLQGERVGHRAVQRKAKLQWAIAVVESAALDQQDIGSGHGQYRNPGLNGVAQRAGQQPPEGIDDPDRDQVGAYRQSQAVEDELIAGIASEAERLRRKSRRQGEIDRRVQRHRRGGRQVQQAEAKAADTTGWELPEMALTTIV